MTNRASDEPDGGPPTDSASTPADLGDLSRRMLARLNSTIEGDIIPRLMLAFDAPASRARPDGATDINLADNVDEFIQLLLKHDAAVANRYVASLRALGIPLPALYLELLAPAARRLGEMWEEDECSFTDVTIAVCRMHEVLLEFSRCFDPHQRSDTDSSSVLVLPAPGEQHTFGLFMVIEFFRRSGWHCYTGTPSTGEDFRRLVRARDYAAIGISVSSNRHLESAAEQIRWIRARKSAGETLILAGGRAFVEDPGAAAEMGADLVATDAEDAVRQLRGLRQERRP